MKEGMNQSFKHKIDDVREGEETGKQIGFYL